LLNILVNNKNLAEKICFEVLIMSKTQEKSEITSKNEGKVEQNSAKTLNLMNELKEMVKDEIPFLNWNEVKVNSVILIQISEIEERFAEGNVIMNNKQQKMRFALSSSLKTQMEKMDVIKGDLLGITYLGVKVSNLTGNEYHSFIVKKKVGTRYLTTNQYLDGLNPF
jgi:hypothetical protein